MKLSVVAGERTHDVEIERHEGGFRVTVDGAPRTVDVRKLEADFYSIVMEGRSYEVSVEPDGARYHVRHGASQRTVMLADPSQRGREGLRAGGHGPENVVSVMPGKVVRVLVAAGDAVSAGQGLVVVEAMKMENEVESPRDGTVRSVLVEPGRAVEAGAPLVIIE